MAIERSRYDNIKTPSKEWTAKTSFEKNESLLALYRATQGECRTNASTKMPDKPSPIPEP
jgi:hypothetical protein